MSGRRGETGASAKAVDAGKRKVETLTPIISANSLCEARSFFRTALMSAGLNTVTREDRMAPRRMRPACRTLASNS
jgi:hypothetical protein